MTHTPFYRLHVLANYADDTEEQYTYQTAFEIDDLMGIVKTYLEYADKATSFVVTLVKERGDAAKEREVEEKRLREMEQWDHSHDER